MQLTQPMVSVIVPVYKVERYLEQCLVSIVHQSYRDLEILLVDDGSPDNCPQLCDMWAQRDSRIHVIHKPNGGLSDARNAGLRQAHGDLVAFVDSDDWLALDMIEKMTDAMLRNQADMVVCQYVVAYADGRFEKRAPENGPEEILNQQQALSELLIDGRLTNHVWRKLYWRNKIPKDVFPKGRNFEDIYVMPELFAPCKKFVYITDPLYFYRCNENGIVQSAKIKDLRDCLAAQEHAGEVIADICPSLVQQVEMCSVWKTVGLGFYSNYTLIINKLTNIVNTVFYSLTASLGNLIVKENEEKRYHVFLAMQSVSMVLSTVCVSGVFFLISDFVQLWLGRQYVLSELVLVAVVCNLYFSISLLPIWVFREATGLYRKTKYVMLATAVINLVLSVILGKMIGLAGIIFATAIARLTTYFWYEPYLLFRNYFGQSCSVYFKGVFKSVITTLCILAIEYLCVGSFHPTGWLLWIAKAVFVCGASSLCVFILYGKSEGFQIILDKVGKVRNYFPQNMQR